MKLRVGFPSKGRMSEQAEAWFSSLGLRIERNSAARTYAVQATGMNGVELVMLSPADIALELTNGSIHLGVTGLDIVREAVPNWARQLEEIKRLGFARADLVIAVPEFWLDARDVDDLDEIAGQFRRRHGMRLRIATKYRNLTHEFLQRREVADYRIVDSGGATEGAIANGLAEVIADISSSGRTLSDNGLKRLSDGLILHSEAVMFKSHNASFDGVDQPLADFMDRTWPRRTTSSQDVPTVLSSGTD